MADDSTGTNPAPNAPAAPAADPAGGQPEFKVPEGHRLVSIDDYSRLERQAQYGNGFRQIVGDGVKPEQLRDAFKFRQEFDALGIPFDSLKSLRAAPKGDGDGGHQAQQPAFDPEEFERNFEAKFEAKQQMKAWEQSYASFRERAVKAIKEANPNIADEDVEYRADALEARAWKSDKVLEIGGQRLPDFDAFLASTSETLKQQAVQQHAAKAAAVGDAAMKPTPAVRPPAPGMGKPETKDGPDDHVSRARDAARATRRRLLGQA